ncbi:MAG: 2-phosphosulfolactate phosphatase [Patescibacteria group bacterium]
MNIEISQRIEGAKQAKGLVVIIDVFRAFSTACYIINGGAKKIIPIGDIEIAYQLKKENPNFILIGESNGYIQPGFDFGNSPFQIRNFDFSGKTVVYTTSTGTQGIANAKNAEEILTGSFVNTGAIIDYIKSKNPENVSLICTGTANETILDEDAVCARYIKNALIGKPDDFMKIIDHLKTKGFANPFFDPKRESHPVEDFDLCMTLDKFNFVLKVEPYKDNLVYLRKIESKGFVAKE